MLKRLREGTNLHRQVIRLAHRSAMLRLGLERWHTTLPGRGLRPRIMSTACWRFPIYSQNFVYQELAQLVKHGYDLRFLYSELETADTLPAQFDAVWRGRRRMFLNEHDYDRDFRAFHDRMPEKVDALLRLLCEASGLSDAELRDHYHIKQSFSFARMVEAFKPHYLHSYFLAISEFPKWSKYLILLSFQDNSSARSVQIGGWM